MHIFIMSWCMCIFSKILERSHPIFPQVLVPCRNRLDWPVDGCFDRKWVNRARIRRLSNYSSPSVLRLPQRGHAGLPQLHHRGACARRSVGDLPACVGRTHGCAVVHGVGRRGRAGHAVCHHRCESVAVGRCAVVRHCARSTAHRLAC